MDENSLTIAILREIRDNTAKTNERLDALTDRVDSLESLTSTMAAVQVRQEQILVRLAEASERHEEGIKSLLRVTERIDARIDNLVEGTLAATVREHETRLRRLEGRDD